jgi:hypothetical protein
MQAAEDGELHERGINRRRGAFNYLDPNTSGTMRVWYSTPVGKSREVRSHMAAPMEISIEYCTS